MPAVLRIVSVSLLDVEVFAWWKYCVGRYRWVGVLVSNGISTLVESAVFVGIAFVGVLPVVPLVTGH